jgi:hypothetical protein
MISSTQWSVAFPRRVAFSDTSLPCRIYLGLQFFVYFVYGYGCVRIAHRRLFADRPCHPDFLLHHIRFARERNAESVSIHIRFRSESSILKTIQIRDGGPYARIQIWHTATDLPRKLTRMPSRRHHSQYRRGQLLAWDEKLINSFSHEYPWNCWNTTPRSAIFMMSSSKYAAPDHGTEADPNNATGGNLYETTKNWEIASFFTDMNAEDLPSFIRRAVTRWN